MYLGRTVSKIRLHLVKKSGITELYNYTLQPINKSINDTLLNFINNNDTTVYEYFYNYSEKPNSEGFYDYDVFSIKQLNDIYYEVNIVYKKRLDIYEDQKGFVQIDFEHYDYAVLEVDGNYKPYFIEKWRIQQDNVVNFTLKLDVLTYYLPQISETKEFLVERFNVKLEGEQQRIVSSNTDELIPKLPKRQVFYLNNSSVANPSTYSVISFPSNIYTVDNSKDYYISPGNVNSGTKLFTYITPTKYFDETSDIIYFENVFEPINGMDYTKYGVFTMEDEKEWNLIIDKHDFNLGDLSHIVYYEDPSNAVYINNALSYNRYWASRLTYIIPKTIYNDLYNGNISSLTFLQNLNNSKFEPDYSNNIYFLNFGELINAKFTSVNFSFFFLMTKIYCNTHKKYELVFNRIAIPTGIIQNLGVPYIGNKIGLVTQYIENFIRKSDFWDVVFKHNLSTGYDNLKKEWNFNYSYELPSDIFNELPFTQQIFEYNIISWIGDKVRIIPELLKEMYKLDFSLYTYIGVKDVSSILNISYLTSQNNSSGEYFEIQNTRNINTRFDSLTEYLQANQNSILQQRNYIEQSWNLSNAQSAVGILFSGISAIANASVGNIYGTVKGVGGVIDNGFSVARNNINYTNQKLMLNAKLDDISNVRSSYSGINDSLVYKFSKGPNISKFNGAGLAVVIYLPNEDDILFIKKLFIRYGYKYMKYINLSNAYKLSNSEFLYIKSVDTTDLLTSIGIPQNLQRIIEEKISNGIYIRKYNKNNLNWDTINFKEATTKKFTSSKIDREITI